MEPWQQRVVDEREQLQERLQKLQAFLLTDIFHRLSVVDKTILKSQAAGMQFYLDMLNLRISRFTS